jgi:predicted small secreted protein
MKKIALAIAIVITSLSLGGCFVGKGKTPPITTRG